MHYTDDTDPHIYVQRQGLRILVILKSESKFKQNSTATFFYTKSLSLLLMRSNGLRTELRNKWVAIC
jgi:hypothetical protein